MSEFGGSSSGASSLPVGGLTGEVLKKASASDGDAVWGDVAAAHVSGLGSLATQNGTFSGTSSGTNTGDQTSVSGNAGTATALATGRTIGLTGDVVWTSPSFDGSGNVTAVAAIGSGVIVDADVNAGAAIAIGKLSGVAASGANADITALSALATISTVTENAIGATGPAVASNTGVGLYLDNTTAATNTVSQTSPSFRLGSFAWNSGSGASQKVIWQIGSSGVSGSTASANLNIQFSTNAGAFTLPFTLTNSGALTLLSSITCTTGAFSGAITSGAITSTGSLVAGTGSTLGWTSKGGFTAPVSGRVLLAGTGGAALTRFTFHAETSSDAAFQISGTGITTGLGDGTAGGSFAASGTLAVTGNTTLGAGTAIKNIRHGVSNALVAGTVSVTDTGATANTRYFFTTHTIGTITLPGSYYASARSVGASFTLTSSQITDTSTVDWVAVEP